MYKHAPNLQYEYKVCTSMLPIFSKIKTMKKPPIISQNYEKGNKTCLALCYKSDSALIWLKVICAILKIFFFYVGNHTKSYKMIWSDNFDKSLSGINVFNKVLVSLIPGQNGDFLKHIYKKISFSIFSCTLPLIQWFFQPHFLSFIAGCVLPTAYKPRIVSLNFTF